VEHLQFRVIVPASDRWTSTAPVMNSITVLYGYRLCVCVCVCVCVYTQGVSGGIVNILGGGSMDYAE
jgi:hypothetical protein